MMGFILDHELCSKEIVGLVAATLGTISFIYNEFILWLIYGVMIKSLPIILAALFRPGSREATKTALQLLTL